MSNEEFAAIIKRTDLTETARERYDREAARRANIQPTPSLTDASVVSVEEAGHEASSYNLFIMTGWGVLVTTLGISAVFGLLNAPGPGGLIILIYWV